jgi:hypothetical protein
VREGEREGRRQISMLTRWKRTTAHSARRLDEIRRGGVGDDYAHIDLILVGEGVFDYPVHDFRGARTKCW